MPRRILQLFNAMAKLAQKCATNQSSADHSDGKGLAGKIKGGMQPSQCLCCFVLLDDSRNITFGRTLRDRSYVDARFAERAEKLPSHPKPFDHPVTNHGEDAATFSQVDYLNFAALHLDEECLLNCHLCELRLRLRNSEAD